MTCQRKRVFDSQEKTYTGTNYGAYNHTSNFSVRRFYSLYIYRHQNVFQLQVELPSNIQIIV